MDPFLLPAVLGVIAGVVFLAGPATRVVRRVLHRGPRGRAPQVRRRPPRPAQLQERRRRAEEREQIVRTRYAQSVSIAGIDDERAARAEDVDDPRAERFLDALAATDQRRAALDGAGATPSSSANARDVDRRLRLYESAVTGLEHAWSDLTRRPPR